MNRLAGKRSIFHIRERKRSRIDEREIREKGETKSERLRENKFS